MYIDRDRCIQCGARARPSLTAEEIGPFAGFSSDGTFRDLTLWFCSIECYQKAVGKFLNTRFHFDKDADDPEYVALESHWTQDYNKLFERSFFVNLFTKKGWSSRNDWVEPHLIPFRKNWIAQKQACITEADNKFLERIAAEVEYQDAQRREQEGELVF